MRRTLLIALPCLVLLALLCSRSRIETPPAAVEGPTIGAVPNAPSQGNALAARREAKPWTPGFIEAIPLEFRSEYFRSTWEGDSRLSSGTGGIGLADRPAEERKRLFEAIAPHVDRNAFDQLTPDQADGALRIAEAGEKGEDIAEICFSKGTALARVQTVHAIAAAARAAKKNNKTSFETQALQLASRWSITATNGTGLSQGDPTVVTWSIVPDGTSISGGSGEPSAPSNLRATLNGIYGNQATWLAIFQQTMNRVAQVAGVRLVYEANDDGSALGVASGSLGVRGDVRIGGHAIDGFAGVLAYNYFPNNGDMVLDTNDGLFLSTSSTAQANNSLLLRNIVAHENGHGLGLRHVCPLSETKLMEPFLSDNFDGLQFDDIYSLNRHYGDPNEPNDAFGTNSTDLGDMTPTSVYVSPALSIDDNGDIDDFFFTFPQTGHDVTVEVKPLAPAASPYLEGAQNASSGDCLPGAIFDPKKQNDLYVALFDSNGNLIRQSDIAGLGQTEIMPAAMPSVGGYYVRVGGGDQERSQMYELKLTFATSRPHVSAGAHTLFSETCLPANGAPDPGETVTVDFTIRNTGAMAITNLKATLVTGTQVAASQTNPQVTLGPLAPAASTTARFTFRFPGAACGAVIPVNIACQDGTTSLETLIYNVQVGKEVVDPEGFDSVAAPALPANWSNVSAGNPSIQPADWKTVATTVDTTPNSAFAPNAEPQRNADGTLPTGGYVERSLLSKPYAVSAATAKLVFRHFYDLEPQWDGAVLEIKVGQGNWTDIEQAGGVFVSGSYNMTVTPNSTVPIKGRGAWGSSSPGFVTTEIDLPASLQGQTVQFRWRLCSDISIASTGWFVDSIRVQSGYECCEVGAEVTLAVPDDVATEPSSGTATDTARFVVTRTGATSFALPVQLTLGGTATNGFDYVTVPSTVTIPIGAASANVDIQPLADAEDLQEITETVTLAIAPHASYQTPSESPLSAVIKNTSLRPTLTVEAVDPIASEWVSSGGPDKGTFRITLHGGRTNRTYTLRYAMSGAASNGVDYVTLPGYLDVPQGQTEGSIDLTAIRDQLPEGTEAATLTLTPGPGYYVHLPLRDATATIKDTPFDQWRKDRLVGQTALVGDADDPEGDRFPNIVEYAFGLDPLKVDDAYCETGKETVTPQGGGEPTHFVTMDYRIPASVLDVLHQPECSTNVTTWTPATVTTSVVDSTAQHTTYRARVQIEPDTRKFLHVKISRPQ